MEYKISRLNPFGLCISAQRPNDDVRELNVELLREWVRREHLIVLRGFHTFEGPDDLSNFCALWGEISLWPFGKVLELIERENPEDHIFDNNYVPLHWDGMYRPQIPEFQIFHCVKAPLIGQGGLTTFSNTVLALELASAQPRALWSKVTGHYRRKMEFYDSETVSPVVTEHPQSGVSVIRYNEPPARGNGDFLNPPILEFTGIEQGQLTEFHQTLKAALYSPANYYAHAWQTGDIVVSDNYSLLHGREGFISRSPRHLRRVHILGTPPLNNPCLVSYR